MLHLDIVSPAAMILGGLFFLIMLPASYGKAMADISLAKIHSGSQQEIALIELDGTQSFCGENALIDGQTITWEKMPANNFTIHLLGHWGDSILFAKVNDQNATRPLSRKDYSICMLSSSAVNTIVFLQGTSIP